MKSRKYLELINPSDKYTLNGEDLKAAVAAVWFLSNRYGLEDDKGETVLPPMFCGGEEAEAWFERKFGEPLTGYVKANRLTIADVLDSFVVGGRSERVLYDEAIASRRGAAAEKFRDEWHDRRRGSMNDIGGFAWSIAKHLREVQASEDAAPATKEGRGS